VAQTIRKKRLAHNSIAKHVKEAPRLRSWAQRWAAFVTSKELSREKGKREAAATAKARREADDGETLECILERFTLPGESLLLHSEGRCIEHQGTNVQSQIWDTKQTAWHWGVTGRMGGTCET